MPDLIGTEEDDFLRIRDRNVEESAETYTLNGLAGDDTLVVHHYAGRYSNFILDGGVGDDVLRVRGYDAVARYPTQAELYGGDGSDKLYLKNYRAGIAILDGGDGNDLLSVRSNHYSEEFQLYAGAGDDVTVVKIRGIDVLTINDGAGDDMISVVSGGIDIADIRGGEGNDTIRFEAGSIIDGLIAGGAGDDHITVVIHDNFTDFDNFYTRPYINGGEGNDVLIQRGLASTALAGGDGDDLIRGGEGEDNIYGGNDTDKLYGGGGDDKLIGGLGDDRLYGGTGNDILEGGAGNDRLIGGEGTDTAVYSGDLSDFEIVTYANGNMRVIDQRTDQNDQATDFLTGIEILQFDDFTLTWTEDEGAFI